MGSTSPVGLRQIWEIFCPSITMGFSIVLLVKMSLIRVREFDKVSVCTICQWSPLSSGFLKMYSHNNHCQPQQTQTLTTFIHLRAYGDVWNLQTHTYWMTYIFLTLDSRGNALGCFSTAAVVTLIQFGHSLAMNYTRRRHNIFFHTTTAGCWELFYAVIIQITKYHRGYKYRCRTSG